MLSPPATRLTLDSVIVIVFILSPELGAFTVTDASALMLGLSELTAVMRHEPEPVAVTFPYSSTTATFSSELCHIILVSFEFAGYISAESCFVAPVESNSMSFSERIMLSIGINSFSETSTETVALIFES